MECSQDNDVNARNVVTFRLKRDESKVNKREAKYV